MIVRQNRLAPGPQCPHSLCLESTGIGFRFSMTLCRIHGTEDRNGNDHITKQSRENNSERKADLIILFNKTKIAKLKIL